MNKPKDFAQEQINKILADYHSDKVRIELYNKRTFDLKDLSASSVEVILENQNEKTTH